MPAVETIDSNSLHHLYQEALKEKEALEIQNRELQAANKQLQEEVDLLKSNKDKIKTDSPQEPQQDFMLT